MSNSNSVDETIQNIDAALAANRPVIGVPTQHYRPKDASDIPKGMLRDYGESTMNVLTWEEILDRMPDFDQIFIDVLEIDLDASGNVQDITYSPRRERIADFWEERWNRYQSRPTAEANDEE